MFAYRATIHSSTNQTPCFLVLGRETRSTADLMWGPPPSETSLPPSVDDFVERKMSMMQHAFRLARETLGKCAERRKVAYDMRVRPQKFNVGDWVWVYSFRRPAGKSPKWLSPYEDAPALVVRELEAPTNVVIQRSQHGRLRVIHVDRLKACVGPTPRSWLIPAPDPVDVEKDEGGSAVEVESRGNGTIVGSRPKRVTRRPARFIDNMAS
jgi:hypothetical protein